MSDYVKSLSQETKDLLVRLGSLEVDADGNVFDPFEPTAEEAEADRQAEIRAARGTW
jgi:hypothetical protein